MMTHDEIIEVVKANKEGKPIQFRRLFRLNLKSDEWRDVLQPGWDFANNEYRKKPEPIEAWAVVTANGATFGVYQYRHFAESAVNSTTSDLRIVRLVEEGGDA